MHVFSSIENTFIFGSQKTELSTLEQYDSSNAGNRQSCRAAFI